MNWVKTEIQLHITQVSFWYKILTTENVIKLIQYSNNTNFLMKEK